MTIPPAVPSAPSIPDRAEDALNGYVGCLVARHWVEGVARSPQEAVIAIAHPVVAVELRAQAAHMDWVAAGAGERYALAAADFAHRLRARADELDPQS